MKNIVEIIREYVINKSEVYMLKNNYDFWNEHIKYVVKNAIDLAKKNNADLEVVEIAALLHDISLICEQGPREEHHIYSSNLAEVVLIKNNYPQYKIDKVKMCIYNHRDRIKYPRNTIEEECVGDADIISHFDNVPMLFSKAYIVLKLSHSEGIEYVKEKYKEDFNGLSPKTQIDYKKKYEKIITILFGKQKTDL